MVYVIWTDSAIKDLRAIKDYIAQSAPDVAERFCVEFLDAPDRLERFPRSGQVVPEFAVETIREIQFRGYRIIYQVGDDACYIRAVMHASRDMQRHINPAAWNQK